jgi:hypothetical protein
MRALLERLTGRYTFEFKPVKLRWKLTGDPDKKLEAWPTKQLKVVLEYYEVTDGWTVMLYDYDLEPTGPHSYYAGMHHLPKGATQRHAIGAAEEVALKYLDKKRESVWREP